MSCGETKPVRRWTAQGLGIFIVVATTAALRAEDAAGPWYERALVGLEVGPTGAQGGNSDSHDDRYCSIWDGAEIVRQAVAAQAEYLVLWLRDGDFAYYDSSLLPKPPGIAGRDPLRDAVTEARRHGLPLISYCVAQQSGRFLRDHPEWEMRGHDGRPLGRMCFNSGYLEAMKQIAAEQLAYGIDGFHIDMLDQGFSPPYGCWCPSCQKLFQQRYGHAMPAGVTWDAAWDEMLEFRYWTSDHFEQELTAHIRSIDSRATVDFNYHGNPPFSFPVGQRPVQHARNGDFVTGETGIWGFSALSVGLTAEFLRAATPGRPVQLVMQRGVRMYHDQTTRPLDDLRWEMFTLLAHGGFVTVVDKTGFDGWLDPVAYQRFGQVMQEARGLREHFGHQPIREVGIYFSSRTRDWLGRDNPEEYFASFQGAHRCCVMEHLQFGILLDENASLEELRTFPVICLPNVGILTTEEAERLQQYVRQGGNLLITGQSGQFDRWGQPLPNSVLSPLIGANVRERLMSRDNWVRFGSESDAAVSFSSDLRADWPFLVYGTATIYEPTTAQVYGQLMRPFRATGQADEQPPHVGPMSADKVVGPALLVNRLGQGTVVTCAASPDYATASEYAIVEARTLLRNALQFLLPRRRVEVLAPANVEAVVTQDETRRTLRVHLLAYNSTPRSTPLQDRPRVVPGPVEDAPIFRVKLRLPDPSVQVTSVRPSTTIRTDEGVIDATVQDVCEVLVIRDE